jgi:GNAT superfamily N-acetyltransferase
MLFAEANNEVIAIVLSFLESNGNIIIGPVATDERYRKHGIAKELMLLVEKRAKELGVHLLALGSAETAEGFYAKLGYTGQLLIQSEKHTIDELLSLNPGYPMVGSCKQTPA